MSTKRRLIVAITGASGAIYGVRMLQALRALPDCETHLVMSASSALTASQEVDLKRSDIEALADVVHSVKDIGATIASGSFRTIGMVIAPCSMKTLAGVAHGIADNLISRAADVVRPGSIEDMVDHTVGRVLDLFDLDHELVRRWQGLQRPAFNP